MTRTRKVHDKDKEDLGQGQGRSMRRTRRVHDKMSNIQVERNTEGCDLHLGEGDEVGGSHLEVPWVGGEHQRLMERPPDRLSKVQQNSASLCVLMAHLT